MGRMQKVLQECGCSLKEEELTDLLNRFSSTGLAVLLTWSGREDKLAHGFLFFLSVHSNS